VQYARAMGLHVVAIDVADDKLALAKELGAELVVNAKTEDAAAVIQREIGGAHGLVTTAVSVGAFKQGVGMLRRGGTMALVGLPPGDFPTPIFEVVLKRLTIRGSIVGTRMDLEEALAFAADGTVKATVETQPLDQVNAVFERLRRGDVNGRVVLQLD